MSPHAPLDLRCEGFASPAVCDRESPRLTWAVSIDRQVAYQVQVGSHPGGSDLWDSGRTETDRQDVTFAGTPPKAWTDAFWRVRIWNGSGEESPWSDVAVWNPGLARGDWSAEWIGSAAPPPATVEAYYEDHPCPLLRKEFVADGEVRRALVAVCSPGYHELRLNGRKIGDAVLDPAWTNFSKRVFYSLHDVTADVRSGGNAIGVMLGNGWWNPLPMLMFGRWNLREYLAHGAPCVRLMLRIEYRDGRIETVATDESWGCGDGHILRNNIYLGESYDATRQVLDWDRPMGYAQDWRSASKLPGPGGAVETAPLPPVRVRQRVPAISVCELSPGTYIVDFGQNLAGVVEAKFRSPRGTKVTLRYGELLHENGSLNVLTSCACQIKKGGASGGPGAPETAEQRDIYVCAGGGEEVYTPRFTWHGFRYMEVTGLPYAPNSDDFTALWLNSSVEEAGEFYCDLPLLPQIQHLAKASLLSNIFSVQSDCPHRERFGYGADIAATTEYAMMNLNMEGFYAKAAQDFADDQDECGGITETAPYMGIADRGFGGRTGSIGWGVAHAVLVRDHFRHYGNLEHVRRQFDSMRGYSDFLSRQSPDGIVEHCISDHESIAPLPVAVSATAHLHQQVAITAWAAERLGRSDEAATYRERAHRIRDAFNQRFFRADTGIYDFGSQACQAIPLWHGLVPAAGEEMVFARLLDAIEAAEGHFTTGIYGTKYILDVLSNRGRADVAHRMVTASGFPGYAHMLDHGATTLWEHWALDTRTFSHNHPMFGSVSEWFFHHVAGLAPAQDAQGFDRGIVHPKPVGQLRRAAARHRTWRGTYSTSWRIVGRAFELEVEVPGNCRAEVMLPGSKEPLTLTHGHHRMETKWDDEG